MRLVQTLVAIIYWMYLPHKRLSGIGRTSDCERVCQTNEVGKEWRGFWKLNRRHPSLISEHTMNHRDT